MRITNALVKGAANGQLVDIDIDPITGKITTITPAAGPFIAETEAEIYDAAGRLVSPQFVEAHIHLDYANTAGIPRDNESGTLLRQLRSGVSAKKRD